VSASDRTPGQPSDSLSGMGISDVPQWGTELAVRGHLSQQLTGSGKAFNDSDDLFLSIAELN
jgi:hypothetical protein